MSGHQAVLPQGRAVFGGLSAVQVVVLSAYGIVLWFIAAAMIRYGTPVGMFGKVANIIAYVLTAPACAWLAVSAARWARLRPGQMVPGVIVVSMAGLFGDAVAIAWAPWLYGADAAAALFGIAWLAFGVACGLGWAVWLDRPADNAV